MACPVSERACGTAAVVLEWRIAMAVSRTRSSPTSFERKKVMYEARRSLGHSLTPVCAAYARCTRRVQYCGVSGTIGSSAAWKT